MDHEGVRITAQHESIHSLYARHCGMEVLALRVYGPRAGESTIVMPMSFCNLRRQYCRAPQQTRWNLVHIVACLIAPSLVMHEPVSVGDATDLQTWRYMWTAGCSYSSGIPFETIEHEARAAVTAWYAMPRHRQQVATVAAVLEQRRFLSGEAVEALLSAAPTPQPGRVAARPAPAPPRPATPVSPAPRAVASQPQPKATPQPLEPEDIIWLENSWRSYGHRFGIPARW